MMWLVWALWREGNQILEIVSSRAASIVGLLSPILTIFIDLEVQHILLVGIQLKGVAVYLVVLVLYAGAIHVFLGDHDGLIAALLVHSLLALVLRIVLAFIVVLHSWWFLILFVRMNNLILILLILFYYEVLRWSLLRNNQDKTIQYTPGSRYYYYKRLDCWLEFQI